MATVGALERPATEWAVGGFPLVRMMCVERRRGKCAFFFECLLSFGLLTFLTPSPCGSDCRVLLLAAARLGDNRLLPKGCRSPGLT